MSAVSAKSDARSTSPSTPLDALLRFYAAEEHYAASGSADFAPIAATLHPDIVLYQPESLPYGGTWRGLAGFETWMKAFTAAWSLVRPRDPVFYQPDEQTLISTVTMEAQSRATGRMVQMPMCQVLKIRDGLPIEWRNFAWDTTQLNAALAHPSSGGTGL
jgi:uncharacterized protein